MPRSALCVNIHASQTLADGSRIADNTRDACRLDAGDLEIYLTTYATNEYREQLADTDRGKNFKWKHICEILFPFPTFRTTIPTRPPGPVPQNTTARVLAALIPEQWTRSTSIEKLRISIHRPVVENETVEGGSSDTIAMFK